MKLIKRASLIILVISVSLLHANDIERNTDRYGGDYKQIDLQSSQNCVQACKTENKCKSWTFLKPTAANERGRCFLKDMITFKSYNEKTDSGIKSIPFSEVQRIVTVNGRKTKFVGLGVMNYNYGRFQGIVDAIKSNPKYKLHIAVKKKSLGTANKRVKNLKQELAVYGLEPRQFKVAKITKKDKKKSWLSKNNQMWIRVSIIRD